jgi:ribosomal protein L37E
VTDPNGTPCPVCDQAAVVDEEGACIHCGAVRCPRCGDRALRAWDEPAALECASCTWTGLAGRGADGTA